MSLFMKNVLIVLLLFGLLLGVYVQEIEDHIERLPAAVQPSARRVNAALEPRLRAAQALWWKTAERVGIKPTPAPAAAPVPDSEPNVRDIYYSDGYDLLRQLRYQPDGQWVRLHASKDPPKLESPGIRCCDTAAIRAYMEKHNKEMEELNTALHAETSRLNVLAGD